MRRRKLAAIWMFFCLACLTGCTGGKATGTQDAAQQPETLESREEATGQSGASGTLSGGDTLEDVAGLGFKPPAGSHRDKKGHIVDQEGNTFDDEGGWQVPEGGSIDAQGRIRDKNGRVMGGGAPVGSKG